jgi:hypothetical protein
MVSGIGKPETTGHGVQATFEGEEIRVSTPVKGKEGGQTLGKTGI